MTTDRDRVEAACRAYMGDDLWAMNIADSTTMPGAARFLSGARARMSRALAAADALAPNDKLKQVYRDGKAALLPAAPPPVPEDVRRALQWALGYAEHWIEVQEIAMPSDLFVKKERRLLDAASALLATPAPPADTGDEGAAGDIERLTRERDEANAATDMIATEREAWKARAEAAERELDAARSLREWTKGKWDEDWTKFAVTYDELKARAEAAEAHLARAREALERARPFVRDAGCDEDPDAAGASCDALELIDRALAEGE